MRLLAGRIAIAVALLLATSCPTAALAQTVAPSASADLRSSHGERVATATFAQAPDEVRIAITFANRTALVGTHAIHIHSVARCDPPDFASAGPILNPNSRQHGLLNSGGPMDGDLPNLVIGPSGVAVYNMTAPLVAIGPGPGANTLLGGRGTSLVIFSGSDDDQSQPEGNPGQRLACGPVVAGVASPEAAAATVAVQALPASRTDPLSTALIVVLGGLLIASGVLLRRTA